MQCTSLRRDLKRLMVYCCVVISAAVLFSSCRGNTTVPNANSATPNSLVSEGQVRTVAPGDENCAFVYYEETFNELGLNPKKLAREELVHSTNLSQVLAYLGYPDLTPESVETKSSAELMKLFPDDILSSGFFAPKITDVSVKDINPGWRKLVRFKAKGEAAKKGIGAGFLLFNKFQGGKKKDYDTDPLGANSNESLNTQLILVRAEGSTLKYPVYFLVFGERSKGSKLITFLTATFDARAPEIVANNKYFVPVACADCHGGLKGDDEPDYDRLKLNYLDTDHWFDRLEDDFAFFKDHTCGNDGCAVLYDGGKDESTPKFEQAFNVLRKLNGEIKSQNEKVPPALAQSFQLRAVNKWLELHETDLRHKDVFARALPPVGTEEIWQADRMPDKELLPLMNRYCYRCHSSLRFNIFERPAVVRRKKNILEFMTKVITDSKKMPQDRNLDCSDKWFADKEEILRLARLLPGATPSPSPTPLPTCPVPPPVPSPTPKPSPKCSPPAPTP